MGFERRVFAGVAVIAVGADEKRILEHSDLRRPGRPDRVVFGRVVLAQQFLNFPRGFSLQQQL